MGILTAMGRFGAHPGWGGGGMGFPLGLIGAFVIGAAFLALAIVTIVALARWMRRAPKTESQEILKARFARGEISKEQYEEMRKVLSS
jgi:putative membrane protein